MTTTSSINPDKLTSDLTNSGNFWIWKAKIYMNLGKFGEAGEELRSENRFTKYDAKEIRTDNVIYNTQADDGSIRRMSRPWNPVIDEPAFLKRAAIQDAQELEYIKQKGNLISYITDHLSQDILNEISNSPEMKNILANSDVLELWALIYKVARGGSSSSAMVAWTNLRQRSNGYLKPMTEFLVTFRGLMELITPLDGGINPIDYKTAVAQLLAAIDKQRYKAYTMNLSGAAVQPTFKELSERLIAIDKDLLLEQETDSAQTLNINSAEAYYSLGYTSPNYQPTYRRGWIPSQTQGRPGRMGILGPRGSATYTAPPNVPNLQPRPFLSQSTNMTCYNCGKRGHNSRVCANPPHQCTICNSFGHLQTYCRYQQSPFHSPQRGPKRSFSDINSTSSHRLHHHPSPVTPRSSHYQRHQVNASTFFEPESPTDFPYGEPSPIQSRTSQYPTTHTDNHQQQYLNYQDIVSPEDHFFADNSINALREYFDYDDDNDLQESTLN